MVKFIAKVLVTRWGEGIYVSHKKELKPLSKAKATLSFLLHIKSDKSLKDIQMFEFDACGKTEKDEGWQGKKINQSHLQFVLPC